LTTSTNNIKAPDWTDGATNDPKINKYQPYKEEVTDETILTFGKHKGQRMIDVPAGWFFWYLETATGVKNYWLLKYMQDNFDVLKSETKNK
jgi:hypothetical protein